MDFNYLTMKNLPTGSWVFWIFVLLFILFLLWLFFGGEEHEYIGLAPMKIGVDSTKYISGQAYAEIEKSNLAAPSIQLDKETKNEKTSFVPSSATGDNSKKIKKISKGEEICRKVMEEIYNKKFPCVRPNFLKNPETKRNLELDCYNDELKLAVEYNGIQHYKWPNFTGQTKEEFINQIRRDKFKVETCDNNGVYLITVPYTVSYDKIRDYIISYLPDKDNLCFFQSENYSETFESIDETWEVTEAEFSEDYSD